jgi:hypothetical protein
VRRNHAEYYLDLVEEVVPAFLRQAQEGWLERVQAEHDNLRTALAH